MNLAKIIGVIQDVGAKENIKEKIFVTLVIIKEENKMITLLGILIIGVIIMYTYVEMDRQEIQKRQEQIQRDLDSLKASIKEEERKRHEEFMNKPYEGGV